MSDYCEMVRFCMAWGELQTIATSQQCNLAPTRIPVDFPISTSRNLNSYQANLVSSILPFVAVEDNFSFISIGYCWNEDDPFECCEWNWPTCVLTLDFLGLSSNPELCCPLSPASVVLDDSPNCPLPPFVDVPCPIGVLTLEANGWSSIDSTCALPVDELCVCACGSGNQAVKSGRILLASQHLHGFSIWCYIARKLTFSSHGSMIIYHCERLYPRISSGTHASINNRNPCNRLTEILLHHSHLSRHSV